MNFILSIYSEDLRDTIKKLWRPSLIWFLEQKEIHCNFPLFFWWREAFFCQQENAVPLRFLGHRSEAWISKKKQTFGRILVQYYGQFKLQCRQWQAASFLPVRKGHIAVIFIRERKEGCLSGGGGVG